MAEITEQQVDAFMRDPLSYFESSITQMHSVERDELHALQAAAMKKRFAEHVESIEIVRNLANKLEISEVQEFNDIVPMLFPHTVFKSYPPALIDRKRFDLMTQWLNKVTSYDLSGVDASGCESLDEWLDVLDAETPLEVITSSGTTGTISLIPKSALGAMYNMKIWRCFLFQTFG
ncbi:MAG: hypothetical protein AB8B48_07815, partial [Pseudomonadales bacterium]